MGETQRSGVVWGSEMISTSHQPREVPLWSPFDILGNLKASQVKHNVNPDIPVLESICSLA